MNKKIVKKVWQKPAINNLSIKELTLSGINVSTTELVNAQHSKKLS